MNCKMPELLRVFESVGFTRVKTVLASGNVVFDARKATEGALERKCEKAMDDALEKSFMTIVRSIDDLRAMLEADPFADYHLPPGAKRVVTFLREEPREPLVLPIERDGAQILSLRGRELFTAYVPDPKKGGAFMSVIEKACGKGITTRTWETVIKVTSK